jgi:hypothetical protein
LVTGKPSQSSSDFFDSVNQGSNYDGNAFSDIGNAISDTWGDFKDTVGSWFD